MLCISIFDLNKKKCFIRHLFYDILFVAPRHGTFVVKSVQRKVSIQETALRCTMLNDKIIKYVYTVSKI